MDLIHSNIAHSSHVILLEIQFNHPCLESFYLSVSLETFQVTFTCGRYFLVPFEKFYTFMDADLRFGSDVFLGSFLSVKPTTHTSLTVCA